MTKINWRLRLQNKAILSAIITGVIALVYQVLGVFNVVPAISEEMLIKLFGILINILGLLGIVVDPSTPGIADSERVQNVDSLIIEEEEV